MYDTLLNTITKRMHTYGETLQPPCSHQCLKNLRLRAKLELDCDVSDEYVRFLKKANGLDWNGVIVFACERTPIVGYSDRLIDGFVEANLDFRDHEPMKDYLVFADDGVALFTFHVARGRYEVITRVGLSLLESFSSFDELLTNALSGHM